MELVAIRRVILGVLMLGMAGLLAELALISHYEDAAQVIPIALLAAGLLVLPGTWPFVEAGRNC